MDSFHIENIRLAFRLHSSNRNKILVFFGLLIFSLSVFSLLSLGLLKPLFGLSPLAISDYQNTLENPLILRALEFLQIMQAFGLFIVPVFIFAYLADSNPLRYLSFTQKVSAPTLLAVIVILFTFQPLINLMADWNAAMKLPPSLHSVEAWMKNSEDDAAKITAAFLNMNSVLDFSIVFFMVALLPAIGEELLFRGVFQKLLKGIFKNSHLAILSTAFLFSALHMQFYGFLPRFVLGALFGYLLEWSGSIWLPVLGHFINNSSAVVFSFLSKRGMLNFDPDKIGGGKNDLILVIVCVCIITLLLVRIHRQKKFLPNDEDEPADDVQQSHLDV